MRFTARDYEHSLDCVRRGNLHRDRGDFDRALAAYESALASTAQVTGIVHLNRGYLFEKCGDAAHALAEYQRAAALLPDDAWLVQALTRVQQALAAAQADDYGAPRKDDSATFKEGC